MAFSGVNPLAGILKQLQIRQAFQNLQNPASQVPAAQLPIRNGALGLPAMGAPGQPTEDEDALHHSLMGLGPRRQLETLARARAVASTVQNLRSVQPAGLYGGK